MCPNPIGRYPRLGVVADAWRRPISNCYISLHRSIAAKIDDVRATRIRFLAGANNKERNIDWRTLHGVMDEDLVPRTGALAPRP